MNRLGHNALDGAIGPLADQISTSGWGLAIGAGLGLWWVILHILP